MKKLSLPHLVPIGLLILTTFVFCNKRYSNQTQIQQVSVIKSFPEINLSIDLIFETHEVSKAEVKTSPNFEIESISSTYNEEQKREYISLKCKRKGGIAEAYFVYIIRESDDTAIASYLLSNN